MATENHAAELLDEIFGPGDHFAPEPVLRGVRLKPMSTGHLMLANPLDDGPTVIKVQQVPADVTDAEVARRMNSVAVLRRDRTLAYGEIKPGAILR